MTPLSKQQALHLLHLPANPPPTCLFSQTAADCRRRRRAIGPDCELSYAQLGSARLGSFGTLANCDKRCPGPAWSCLHSNVEFVVTGCLHGDRDVREHTCVESNVETIRS